MRVGLVPYRGSRSQGPNWNTSRHGCEQREVGSVWGETGGGVERVTHRPEQQLGLTQEAFEQSTCV